jgi:hypothetical protein
MELRPLDLFTIQQLTCTLVNPTVHKKARQQTGLDKTIALVGYSVSIPRLTVPAGVIIVGFWNSELALTLR